MENSIEHVPPVTQVDRELNLDREAASQERQHISSAASATEADVRSESIIANEDHEATPPPESSSHAATAWYPFQPIVKGKRTNRKKPLTRQKALSEIYRNTWPTTTFKNWERVIGNKQVSTTKGKEEAAEALTKQNKNIKWGKQNSEETGLRVTNNVSNLKAKEKIIQDLTGKTKTSPKKRKPPLTRVPAKGKTEPLKAGLLTEEKMRHSFYAKYDDTVWAWIYGGATYAMEDWHQESQLEEQSRISNFARELASEIEESDHQSQHSGVDTTSNIKRNALNFANLLFIINLRLIRSLKTMPDTYYLEEHARLQQWILEVERSRLAYSDTMTRRGITFPKLTLEQVVSNVNEVIFSNEADKVVKRVVRIKNSGTETFIGVISDSQLKMTKAIVPLLAYYYKSHNLKKWKSLFKHEGRYLAHLSKLQTPAYASKSGQLGVEKPYVDVLKLLPWKGRGIEHAHVTKYSNGLLDQTV
ncbi:hypothetical protein PTTG_28776 [Puccinia triticina 1-1 BBBD Race 1]|uniref:Uncharacterized protein n=1 Tax=Puccinia triticina (isolate 1-1 / race 1 (BBBD)) TaxID=630390 RepID=A0A180GBA8_PUCT1|nr:hypothetical protein PTTG_28776 [Puccinia triticina 1-1 BBBD Race 1]